MIQRYLLPVFLLLSACNYNRLHGEAAPLDPDVGELGTLSGMDYLSIQALVVDPNCLSCHSSKGGNKGGLNLETYQQVRANLNKIYYRSIEKRDMPAEGLSEGQHSLLKSWIEAGAPEKSTGSVVKPIQGPVTWSVVKKQIFKTSCLDCHSGSKPDGNLDLESLEVTRKNITAIFDATIVRQSMPLEPYAAMPEVYKQALMKWISQGMPE